MNFELSDMPNSICSVYVFDFSFDFSLAGSWYSHT